MRIFTFKWADKWANRTHKMMQKNIQSVALASLILAGLTLADDKSKPATTNKIQVTAGSRATASPMRVDEPSNKPVPKSEFKISKAQRERLQDLSFEQKLAFRLHQEKMQAMINVITEKRRMLQAAKPRERAALAIELHTFILDRETGSRGPVVPARVSSPAGSELGPVISTEAVKYKHKD